MEDNKRKLTKEELEEGFKKFSKDLPSYTHYEDNNVSVHKFSIPRTKGQRGISIYMGDAGAKLMEKALKEAYKK